ncbi:MAG: glycosyltransferase family 4 protein [Actinobacteria bacterium]|nr:glycosyltransferase family 4 protein [Actinomycetota bacterium]
MLADAKDLARRGVRRYRRRRIWDAQLHPRMAFFAPMPPAATGVASYSLAVVDGLRRIGFFDRHRMELIWPPQPKHEGLAPWYRLAVYSLGNNMQYHRDLYRYACHASGLIVLHDLALDDFVRGMKGVGDPLGFVAQREAERLAPQMRSQDALRNEPLRRPWAAHVVRRSRGVIVHSEFCRRYLEEMGSQTPVFVVPHPVVVSDDDMDRARRRAPSLRAPLVARGARTVVVAPGDLNEAKRLDAVLGAVRALPEDVHLVLVGRRIVGYDIDRVVAAGGLGARVTLAPDVSDLDFHGWLCAADVVVDLRFPHRGEVSGTLVRAMQAGVPAVVSATGTYLDVPTDLAARVAPGPTDPAELAVRLRELIEDPDRLARMGAAARDHVQRLRSSEATAHGYEDAIEQTLRLVRDPARTAEARWAGALADIGVDQELLRRGYGVSYARAMEGFRAPPPDGEPPMGSPPGTGTP